MFTGFGEKELSADTLREKRVSSAVKLIGTVYGLDARYKGNIKVSDDDRAVTYITPGGFLEIQKTTFGNAKEVLIESDVKGNLSYTFLDNRNEKAFTPEGQQFLNDVLPEVIEISDVAALDRIDRFFKQGGINKVLKEIEKITSGSNRATYYTYLLERKGLTGEQLGKIASAISENIDSSADQGEIFSAYAYKFLSSDLSATAYFNAIADISSSSEKGRVLRLVLQRPDLSESILKALLTTVEDISSSSEAGEVLRAFNRTYIDSQNIRALYFSAIQDIASSTEQGYTLRHLLDEKALSDESKVQLFKTVEAISSSSEKGITLRHASAQLPTMTDPVAEAFLDVVNSISSSAEQGETLRHIFREMNLSARTTQQLLNSIGQISSSAEQGETIRQIFPTLNMEDETSVEVFFDLIEDISSSAEQGHTLRMLMNEAGSNELFMLQLLKTTATISSSAEQAEVLVAAAPLVKDNPVLRAQYAETARSISSDFEYRRVMEAIN